MIQYRCAQHNITFSSAECPICHERGEFHISEVYWCTCCNVPVYDSVCPVCNTSCKRITTDMRPVFPQERLLIELVLDKPV